MKTLESVPVETLYAKIEILYEKILLLEEENAKLRASLKLAVETCIVYSGIPEYDELLEKITGVRLC